MKEKRKSKRPTYYVERDGKIFARLCYTDSNGKRQQKWKLVETKTKAKELVDEWRQQIKGGTESFEHKGTVDEFLDRWLETEKTRIAEGHYEGCVGLLRLYVRPVLGSKKLSDLKPLHVQGMINGMVARGLSPRTVRYAHSILFRALKRAIRWRMIVSNPADDLELPKQVRREMQALTPEEAKAFLLGCKQDKYGLMFALALITGMRPEEYMGLQWSDIDFQRQALSIQRVVVWKRWKSEWYFCEPKTPRSRRTIPLPSGLVSKLLEWQEHQEEWSGKVKEKWQNYNLVFPSDIGTPLSPRNLQRRHFKPLLVKAGLPDIRLYDLRHSCATLLLAAGENPKVVSERLGHASIVLTLDTYSHVLPTMQKSATDRLESILELNN